MSLESALRGAADFTYREIPVEYMFPRFSAHSRTRHILPRFPFWENRWPNRVRACAPLQRRSLRHLSPPLISQPFAHQISSTLTTTLPVTCSPSPVFIATKALPVVILVDDGAKQFIPLSELLTYDLSSLQLEIYCMNAGVRHVKEPQRGIPCFGIQRSASIERPRESSKIDSNIDSSSKPTAQPYCKNG